MKNFIKKIQRQEGYVVSIITFFVLIIMLSIAISISFSIALRQKVATNSVKSTQSYYAAESGVEDALLRLNNNPQMQADSYVLNVNDAVVNVTIPNVIAGSRVIVSQGNDTGMIKSIQTTYSINSQNVSFHYGAQVGAGGLQMNSNSRIKGSVFSNGNISGSGSGIIENDVVISGNGKSIQGPYVGGDVLAYSCLSSSSVRNLTYITGGQHTCTVRGTTSVQSEEITAQPLPISETQINDWKAETANGTPKAAYNIDGNQTVTENSSVVITGNMVVGGNATWNLMGYTKIIGSLTLNSNARLNMSGTLYVTGNIILNSNALVQLSSSYGALSGIVLSDGTITLNSNALLRGSGQAGSYVLSISTSSSNSAITINSNAIGAIFYTIFGGIQINSNASLREVTGYRITLNSNAVVQYESGLANLFFSSGPGGSWEVTSWGEQ